MFIKLEKELDFIIKRLRHLDLLDANKIKREELLKVLNDSTYYLTLHDVENYKPVLLNNNMRDFYGFKSNYLKKFDYYYYLKTIHVSMYSSLIKSVSFFRRDNEKNLNLEYKLLNNKKEWKEVIGTTQTIIRTDKDKPKYAITLAVDSDNLVSYNIENEYTKLTKKEKEIAIMLTNGVYKKDILKVLNISSLTLDTHIKRVLNKICISKVTELVALNLKFLVPKFGREIPYKELTKRETQIMKLLAIGLSKKEIGNCLNISEKTVETHTKKIFVKLKIKKVSEIVELNPII